MILWIDSVYWRYSIDSWAHKQTFLQLNWDEYFNSAFRQVNVTIEPSDPVIVYSPDFLRNLSVIIADMLSTEKGKM